jgi:hypothetical protein
MIKKTVIILAILLCSCSIKSEKKYVVVDSFSQIVLETDDKEKAFKQAAEMTLFGRVFASKPEYFVIEVKNEKTSLYTENKIH